MAELARTLHQMNGVFSIAGPPSAPRWSDRPFRALARCSGTRSLIVGGEAQLRILTNVPWIKEEKVDFVQWARAFAGHRELLGRNIEVPESAGNGGGLSEPFLRGSRLPEARADREA